MGYQLIINQAGIGSYVGKAERCVFEFNTLPEQIPGEQWLADQLIGRHVAELETQGSQLLWLRVWRDTAPTWQTNYRVEVTATASPIWWSAIIIGVLAIIAFIIAWKIISESKLTWGDIPGEIGKGIGLGLGIIALLALLFLATREKIEEKAAKAVYD